MKIFIEIEEKHLDAVRRVIEGEGKAAAKSDTEGAGRKEENQTVASAGGEDYESMTSKDLYKLCCDRGISSKCKKRDKASLIKVLRENDGQAEEEPKDDDEWADEAEEKPDPYAGKTARELYNMCCDRGIVVKKKLKPEEYAAKLKEDDEAGSSGGEEDDEWNI